MSTSSMSTSSSTMANARKKRAQDEIEMALTLSIVAYAVVKSQSKTQKEKRATVALMKQKKKNKARPGIRTNRRVLNHQRAYDCIMEDYLGEASLFDALFVTMFRMSRARVEMIMVAFGNSGNSYYTSSSRSGVMSGPSLEARVLLPLKTLAYGVSCHAFSDYFQMSTTFARVCCKTFNDTIAKCFKDEYLRLPTPADLVSITTLHKKAHGVEGMLGSLDCMHTYWKNCPVGWHQSFQGKEKQSTIVLEAVADHYLWFWHASYGYAGALNDINILQLSPLMRRLTDGTFTATEIASGVVPFDIGPFGTFKQCYMLVDGIYPPWCRFVRGFKEPVTIPESRFSTWQEGARKDVERAFGVFQGKWKAVASPIHTMDPKSIASLVTCCLILHNMGVSERVMGNVNEKYDPGSVEFVEREVTAPHDVDRVIAMETAGVATEEAAVEEGPVCAIPPVQPPLCTNPVSALITPLPAVATVHPHNNDVCTTGIDRFNPYMQRELIREKETAILQNRGEWVRLQEAFVAYIDSCHKDPCGVYSDEELNWNYKDDDDDADDGKK